MSPGEKTALSAWAAKWGPVVAVLAGLIGLGTIAVAVGPWQTRAEASQSESRADDAVAAVRAQHAADIAAIGARLTAVEVSSRYQDRILWQLARTAGLRDVAPPPHNGEE